MKFHLGPPVETPGFPPDDSWHLLPMTGMWKMTLHAVPVAVLTMGLMGAAWLYLTAAGQSRLFPMDIPDGVLLWYVVIGVPLHELIHLLALPRCGLGQETYYGFWPSKFVPYVQPMGPLSRERRLFVNLLPFLMLSLLPLLLAEWLPHAHWPFMWWVNRRMWVVATWSILNGMGSSGDLLNVWGMLRLIPRGATVQGNGNRLFWKRTV